MLHTSRSDFDFYNELERKYPETQIVYDNRAGKLRYWFIRRKLNGLRGTLLDIGCNNYYYEQLWKGIYVGVDIAHKLLLNEKRNGIWADAYLLPFKNGRFDYILCIEILEHLWFRAEALREILRVLKPDGEIFLIVPSGSSQPYKQVSSEDNILKEWDVSPYFYLHGNLILSDIQDLTQEVPCVIVEWKYLKSNLTHLYCRIRKK